MVNTISIYLILKWYSNKYHIKGLDSVKLAIEIRDILLGK